jgi:NAD(P)-dependent dehydrogenase (short-subunit alcohol dehydrogenase family)
VCTMRLKTVEEQVVVVFGASSGIGRETALRFARRGAKVVVAARTESALSSLVTEIQQFGGEAIYCVSDAADFEQVKGVADLAIQHFGRIDTWAHVAGTAVIGPFEQTTPEEFKRVIEVNLLGQVYGAMVALPHLKHEGRGALVHVTSVEARRSLPLQSSYSASKHGVEGFLDALRVELAHEKVPVSITNIMPGVINTPFYTKVRSRLGVQPTAVPPFYHPRIVADAILYAAEHPVRDMIVGDVGRVLEFLQRLSPAAMDALLLAIGFKGQRTDVPRPVDTPDNLFSTVPDERVSGDQGSLVVPSFFEWLDRVPAASTLLTAAALGAVALIGSQIFSEKK